MWVTSARERLPQDISARHRAALECVVRPQAPGPRRAERAWGPAALPPRGEGSAKCLGAGRGLGEPGQFGEVTAVRALQAKDPRGGGREAGITQTQTAPQAGLGGVEPLQDKRGR